MPFDRYTQQKKTTNPNYYFGVTDISERDTDIHIEYCIGDRLDRIAYKFYGSTTYWWIILLANPQYAIEYDISIGDIIRIPFPLNDVLQEIRSQL